VIGQGGKNFKKMVRCRGAQHRTGCRVFFAPLSYSCLPSDCRTSARLLFPEAAATALQDRHSELCAAHDVANGSSRTFTASDIVERPAVAFEVGVDGSFDPGQRSGLRRVGSGDAAHCRDTSERQSEHKFAQHLSLSFLWFVFRRLDYSARLLGNFFRRFGA
jgi:hypothetical protein